MASSTLDQLAAGSRVFVDATVFVYHFTGASETCREFLVRCERGELRGTTSVVVLAEVAHRLMMLEALSEGLVSRPDLAAKLRKKPELICSLHRYAKQAERIPLMGIEVLSLDLGLFLRSKELRERWGLMTNDSIVAATAFDVGIEAMASSDRDFERVEKLTLYRPTDI